MSLEVGDVSADPHASGDRGDDHDHADQAHAEEPLGPIDLRAWGAAVLGVALGVVTAACFVLTTTAR
jgi:hypothetical protein